MKAKLKLIIIVNLIITFASIFYAVNLYLNVNKKNMRLATMYPISTDLTECKSEFYSVQPGSSSPFVSNLYDCGDPSAFCSSGDPLAITINNFTTSPINISSHRGLYLLCKKFTPIRRSTIQSVYAVAYDPGRGTPVWSYYELNKRRANGSEKRDGDFYMEDQLLAQGIPQASPMTYNRLFNEAPNPIPLVAGIYAKGHLMPAGDAEDFVESLNASFSFANAVPQHESINSGAWKSIEGFLRDKLVKERGKEVYVITGAYGTIANGNVATGPAPPDPPIVPTPNKIGDPRKPNYQATIPACMYKIIISKEQFSGKYIAIAFLVPNVNKDDLLPERRMKAGTFAISVYDLYERMRLAAADPNQSHNYYFKFDNYDLFSDFQDKNFWNYWKFRDGARIDTNQPELGDLQWYDYDSTISLWVKKPYPIQFGIWQCYC